MKLKQRQKPKPKHGYKPLWIACAIALGLFSTVGVWYVFIAGAPQLDAPPVEEIAGLNFQVETFYSNTMGEERRYGIVLPPGYEHHPTRRYPVIVMLHGGHGNERDYQDKAALTAVLDSLYRSHQLPPSIIVTPDGNDQRGSSPFWDPKYYDSPDGNIATLIGIDLVQEVKSKYRALDQPEFWAIGGLSSGAWGALNIGLRHLDRFHIFLSHTGYFIDNSGDENSPQKFIEELPEQTRRKIRVYLDAGEGDEKYLDATKAFHQTLDRLGIYNEFYVFPGGHGIVGQDVGWNYWHTHLKDSLRFAGQQFHKAQHPHIHK